MNNKISGAIIVILIGVAAWFAVQNMQLKKKIEQQDNNNASNIAPTVSETRPANPEGASPFDKPNVDPMASRFKSQPDIDTMPTTVLKFEKMQYDFGRITEGDIVQTQFKFTNAGKVVLLITHAQPSCGCTVPTTPKDPVKPGESNVIDVVFNSAGKRGETIKTITVEANTQPRQTVISIKATVIPKDN
jgi:Protein of unknown function (DUF1573)